MTPMALLDGLRGKLVVSVQAPAGGPLDDPYVIAAMARAAIENGAAALRIQSERHIRAVKAALDAPVIGIVKRTYPDFEPYITPTEMEVEEIARAGAEIVAFDATRRKRPSGTDIRRLIEAIHRNGLIAMADCATFDDGVAAVAAGVDILATTLCGYTRETKGFSLPSLALVDQFAQLHSYVICEGGIDSPEAARAAFEAGADAIVVGTAITGIDRLVRRFIEATPVHAKTAAARDK